MTQEVRSKKASESRGGIIADEMGTGKTLSLLATVVHTLDSARVLASGFVTAHALRQGKPLSGATLIIAPKSSIFLRPSFLLTFYLHLYLALCNWAQEMSK